MNEAQDLHEKFTSQLFALARTHDIKIIKYGAEEIPGYPTHLNVRLTIKPDPKRSVKA